MPRCPAWQAIATPAQSQAQWKKRGENTKRTGEFLDEYDDTT